MRPIFNNISLLLSMAISSEKLFNIPTYDGIKNQSYNMKEIRHARIKRQKQKGRK